MRSGRTASSPFVGFVALGLVLMGVPDPGLPALVDAAKNAEWDRIRELLSESGVDLDSAAADGTTALHWVSYHDNVEVAGSLVRAGADVNARTDLGAAPIWLAAQNGSLLMTELLLDAGADPEVRLLGGETVLMTAARSGNAEVVERLLSRGADPNLKGARDQTALMWAAAQRHPRVVRALLAHGADVHARSAKWMQKVKTDGEQSSAPAYIVDYVQGGTTPILFAARSGDAASAKFLLEAGADVNDTTASGVTATTLAAHSDHDAVVEVLLEAGADPNLVGGGYTALHAAVLRGNENAVRALLSHGADPEVAVRSGTPTRRESDDYYIHPTFVGATAFWLAARFTQPDLMRLLVEHGADPHFAHDVRYWGGSYGEYAMQIEGPTTALMAAVGMGGRVRDGWAKPDPREREQRLIEAVRLAIDFGIDVNAENAQGRTALDGAMRLNLPDVVALLTSHGARPGSGVAGADRRAMP